MTVSTEILSWGRVLCVGHKLPFHSVSSLLFILAESDKRPLSIILRPQPASH